jgi:S-adenosylmethionine hydrolase
MKKLIVLADWASDSLTNQEIKIAVGGFLKNPETRPDITFVASTPSTIHTSYLLRQLVETEERLGRPENTVIFQNTDPRLQSLTGVEQSKGAEFIVIRLQSGMYLCGPNAGFDFSLIRNKIQQVYRYPNFEKGSQFRSRDLYSRVCAHLMEDMQDEMEFEEVDDVVPELTGHFIGHIDNYGNIKTTLTVEDLKGKVELGKKVSIEINGVKHTPIYASNLFGAGVDKLVIYPGSSGDRDNPFLEITVWTHFNHYEIKTGAFYYNHPRPGQEIVIKKA